MNILTFGSPIFGIIGLVLMVIRFLFRHFFGLRLIALKWIIKISIVLFVLQMLEQVAR